MKGKIYNGFMFFNEFNMLDIRLHELYDTVDKFILVESPHTHRGGTKKLFFDERKKEYEWCKDKLVHIITDLPCDANPWVNENAHRQAITKGLDGIRGNDYLIITDADEIPRANAIKNYNGHLAILSMYFHYYKFNLRNKYPWVLAKMVKWNSCFDNLNEYRKEFIGCDVIQDAGWHFSKVYCMANMKYMFKECLADDLFHDEIINNLEQWSKDGYTNWCGHQNKFDKVPIDETFPEWFRNNTDKFKDYIQ